MQPNTQAKRDMDTNFIKTPNAQLSSEQRTTEANALRRKHQTHCKPKLPRVANLLKLFVMRIVRKR